VDEFELGYRFLDALGAAAQTGDHEPLYGFLAPDIEWEMPQRALHGIDEVREGLTWVGPMRHLDVEFERGDLQRLDDGRLGVDVHETYRLATTREFAFERERRIALTIRKSRIVRYEMRIVG